MTVTRALILVLLTTSLAAKEAIITNGGRRLIDLDPADATTNCAGWSYDAMPLRDDAGNISTVYSAGDALTNHCSSDMTSDDRFGDRIWRHVKGADGTWDGIPVLARENLGWMSDAAYVTSHPEAFVAHFASPSVVRADGRYYMAFAASVNDPHLCAGEHDAQNACGTCADPWSYFTLMWAVSDDGVNWRVRDRDPSNPNRALGASTIWRDPTPADETHPSIYKGVTHVSMIRADGYFYLMTQFWGKRVLKNALFRIAADPSSEFGIKGDPELWHTNFATGHTWDVCPGGRAPDWINGADMSVIVFARPISTIAETKLFPNYRYVALAAGAPPRNDRVEYQLSNDLITWTPSQPLRSAIPFFADGRAYANSVIAPAAAEDGEGKLHLFFSSGDGDDDHGRPHDGIPDCFFGTGSPTVVFIGSGIYESTVEFADLAPTTMTITPKSSTTNIGPTTFVIHVTSPAGKPNGLVNVFGGGIGEAPVVDGFAEVTYPIPTKGDWTISAYFSAPAGPWADSAAATVQHVVNPPPKRRGVGR